MRTDRCAAWLVAAALAIPGEAGAEVPRAKEDRPAPAALRYLEFGFYPEVTLVGLSAGARAELSYRPFGPATVNRLRLSAGFLEGPEFHYVPVAFGYRAVFRPTRLIRPLLGLGLEYQLRWVSDAEAAHQLAIYGELGLQIAVRADLAIGVLGGFDFTFVGGPGPGITCRLGITYSPSDRPGPKLLATGPPAPRAEIAAQTARATWTADSKARERTRTTR